jgi:hypothetical protein
MRGLGDGQRGRQGDERDPQSSSSFDSSFAV